MVRQDAQRSGFVANKEKSHWVPVQSGELLGYVLNLQIGTFQVPQKRVHAVLHVLQDVLARGFVVSLSKVACFTGLLASKSLALGPVVCLWTWSLHRDILHVVSWDSPFQLSPDAQGKGFFWQNIFHNAGYPIWSPSPEPEVLTYSDAGDSGRGGFAVQLGGRPQWGTGQSKRVK